MPTEDEWVTDEPAEAPEPEAVTDPDAIRAAVRQEFEAEFQDHKKQYNRRFEAARRNAQQNGLDIGDDGKILIRDAETARKLVLGAPAAPSTPSAPEAVPDPTYNPDEFRAWNAKQAQQIARDIGTPLEEENKALKATLGQLAVGAAVDNVRGYLEELGKPELADDPQFRRIFADTLQRGNVPMQSWGDPSEEMRLALEGGVGFALSTYRDRQRNGGSAPAAPKTAAPPAPRQPTPVERANRAAVQNGQQGSSRGEAPRSDDFTPEEIDAAAAYSAMRGKTYTPAQYRALGADTSGTAFRQLQEQNARRAAGKR